MAHAPVCVALIAIAVALASAQTASADPGDGHVNGTTDPLILALIANNDVFSLADLATILAPLDPQRHPALRPVPERFA